MIERERYTIDEAKSGRVTVTAAELVKFAAEKYPREFETLNC